MEEFDAALGCPFCGKPPKIKERVKCEGSQTEYVSVGCLNMHCHVRPHVGSVHIIGKARESAIRRWNIRISD